MLTVTGTTYDVTQLFGFFQVSAKISPLLMPLDQAISTGQYSRSPSIA